MPSTETSENRPAAILRDPLAFIGDVARHARLALRPLWRRPAFALAAILSLGIGIGANTTVMSVVDALLVKPLPYAQPERLVAIWPGKGIANQEIAALRARAKSYDQVAGVSPGWLMTLTGVPVPRQLSAARVSGNLFAMLGVPAAVGTTFGMEAEQVGSPQVAVLSYDLWRSEFSADRAIVGRSITMTGQTYTVLGVMPKGFQAFGPGTDLWTPLTMDPAAMTWNGATAVTYGRLSAGVTAAQATAELGVLSDAMRTEFARAPNWSANARVVGLQENLVGGLKPTLFILLAAVGSLLLIAVANVTNLFLVRTSERRQELAVRTTLGATPAQVAALLLGECVALGVVGGAVGIGLAYVGVAMLRLILPENLPRLAEIAVDGRVLAAATAIALLAAVASGVAPALQGMGARAASRIRAGRTIAGSGGRTRGVLVAAEVALALILTVGATVMGRTLVALHNVDRGLRTDHLLTMRLQPSAPSNDGYRAYWTEVLARVKAIPGVTNAATILHLPTTGRNWQAFLDIEGRTLGAGESAPQAAWQSVSNDYFATTGMSVLKGRGFADADGANAPLVMVINSALAEQLFPGEDPVGRRLRAGFATAQNWATIVGVVSSIRNDSLNSTPPPAIYLPFEQRVVVANSLVIRTKGDPAALAGAIRERIWSVNRDVPISDVRTMDDLYSGTMQRQRMILTLFGLFAGAGVLLSAVGIYGVVSYTVRQRTQEIGVRVALGADAGSIRRLIIGQGMRQALAGIAIGAPVAIGLSRFMRGMVFGVAPTDPLSFAAVPALLLLVALAASWLPARRAAKADPCEVLRK